MTTFRNILTAAMLATAALTATAQTNGSNSPYSRYGFGLLGDGGNAFNKGMAGTAYGMRNGTQINSKNPASYSATDSLSFLFDVGMTLQNGNFKQGSAKTNAHNTSVDYVNAAFRLAPRLGMSVGLMPFSTVGYQTSSEETIKNGFEEVVQTNKFSGDGGLHEAYVGLGWAPIKPLSLGFNMGYLWGELSHTVLMSFDDANIHSTRQAYDADVRTFKANFGLQYEQKLNAKHTLTLGVVYGLGHDVNRNAHYYNQKVGTTGVTGGDTLTCANAFALPHTFGVGLTWSFNNQLRVGVDYTLQKWADVKYPTVVTDAYGTPSYVTGKGLFKDMHQVSLGAEYVKDPEGLRWRQRVRYNVGFAYTSPYTRIGGVDGPERYMASIGASLPIINFHNSRSFVNFSAQYEHVKPKMPGMITENYLRFSIGLSFNERWFMKWKAE